MRPVVSDSTLVRSRDPHQEILDMEWWMNIQGSSECIAKSTMSATDISGKQILILVISK